MFELLLTLAFATADTTRTTNYTACVSQQIVDDLSQLSEDRPAFIAAVLAKIKSKECVRLNRATTFEYQDDGSIKLPSGEKLFLLER